MMDSRAVSAKQFITWLSVVKGISLNPPVYCDDELDALLNEWVEWSDA